MNDRNKSPITHEVTVAVASWLDVLGFKPVETEVPIAAGWVADLAAVICPTQTELIALKLIQRPPSWNEIHSLKSKRRTWDADTYRAWQSTLVALRRTMTCLVEVKTSRADYCGDRKWTLPLPTDLAFVAFPRGLVKPEEWPTGWGILEFHDGAIKRLRAPTPQVTADSQQRDIILSIAIRRDHHTRYSRFREAQKDTRLAAATETSLARVRDVVRTVLSVARGEHSNLEECLMFSRLRNHMRTMPEWVLEPLRELYGIANKTPI
jgi:hypothetical protein